MYLQCALNKTATTAKKISSHYYNFLLFYTIMLIGGGIMHSLCSENAQNAMESISIKIMI
jgi:hypothetical protein